MACILQASTPPPPLYKLRPCPSYSRRRVRNNCPLSLSPRHLQEVSMCNCSAWCMIARRVSKPNICRLRILHCLCQHGCEPEIFMFPRLFCVCTHLQMCQRSRCTHTMRAHTCVSVVVCVARKLRPCPSYSGRRDRNNSVHWRSLYKGGGVPTCACRVHPSGVSEVRLMRESQNENHPFKLILTACQIRCHSHLWYHRRTGKL